MDSKHTETVIQYLLKEILLMQSIHEINQNPSI